MIASERFKHYRGPLTEPLDGAAAVAATEATITQSPVDIGVARAALRTLGEYATEYDSAVQGLAMPVGAQAAHDTILVALESLRQGQPRGWVRCADGVDSSMPNNARSVLLATDEGFIYWGCRTGGHWEAHGLEPHERVVQWFDPPRTLPSARE